MTRSDHLLRAAQRLQALAQAGLTYGASHYDLERYAEIRTLSAQLLQEISHEPLEKILSAFASETGYQTPKVDIRAVVFRGTEEVLMVREKIDRGRWTLPGGWADVGFTPFEVAEKEVQEEAGLEVRAVRLLALFDKRKHEHPPQPWYVYKAFIHCELRGGDLAQDTSETAEARWVHQRDVPDLELSLDRVTSDQVLTMFRFAREPDTPVLCD